MSETETKTAPEVDASEQGKYTKKITVAAVCGGKIPKPAEGQTLWLVRLFGEVEKVESAMGDYGDEFLRLVGDMIADRLYPDEDGVFPETRNATSAILPKIGETIVRQHLASVGYGKKDADGKDIGPKTVTFSMDIGVEHSAKSPTGYTWVIKPIGATRKTPLMMYREAVMAKMAAHRPAAISAPKTIEADPDAEKSPAKAGKGK